MNQRCMLDFADFTVEDRERYQRAIERARALGAEKQALQAHFEKHRSDSRVESQIWRLTQFDRYLDRLRDSYCAASDLFSLSIEPADEWPLLDFDRLPRGEEVQSMVVLVSIKHERIKAMSIVALLNELQGLVRVH